MSSFKKPVKQVNDISWAEELKCGASMTFLSINVKMLFKNQNPKQGEKACKEDALSCHLREGSRSKHWMTYWKQNWLAKLTCTGKKV